ncbi:hypothetical protein WH91_03180 [Devosia psychrophila]|uniref:Autoinducer 2 import system permease protein LsrD n=1 Tax=Devosia psychrophila TaxID=728005 RepID=A0ABR5E264_9HYPH|nr:ABC transporter permease [Devosia psychrophila]KKC34385.1 hypothetical protein WH91_03180 [Devosia psychrophila]
MAQIQSASGPQVGRTSARSWFVRGLTSDYLVLALTVVYALALGPFVPTLISWASAREVLIAMMPLLVLAIGQSFVMVIAGIDLSLTSIAALASVVAASIMTGSGGYLAGSALATPVALVAFLGIGVLCGMLNGYCAARLRMPAFMVTLVLQMFLSGVAVWYTSLHVEAVSIGNLPRSFVAIGSGNIFGVPYAVLIAAAVALAAHHLLSRTVLGRWLYAVGINPRAAQVSGVPVARVVLLAFVLSGLCAAIASIIYTGRLETGTPVLADRVLLDVIGAAVIGGVSLFGGKAKILGVFFGVLFLSVVDKGLQLLGMSQFVVFAVKGGLILLAALLDALRNYLLLGADR